jgi:acetolactate synthase-1/3 small subunit
VSAKYARIAIPTVLSHHCQSIKRYDFFAVNSQRSNSSMRHIISILLQNEAGALTRVTSLFSTRGYNIESLSVAPTEDAEVSRLTMVANGSDAVIDQIGKQLFKLVDVVSIIDMTLCEHIERELLLMKVKLHDGVNVSDIVSAAGAVVLDDSRSSFTVELTGTGLQIDGFMETLGSRSEILAVVRSGAMAIARGTAVLRSHLA